MYISSEKPKEEDVCKLCGDRQSENSFFIEVPVEDQILFRNITYSNRPDCVAQLAEHWAGIPKVVGSIPTVVRDIFQACPV